ncbi:MAG: hypothetical protein WBF90_10345 [Rivularia sp. (in: cyanobacteria)]
MAQLLKFDNRTVSATELPHLLAGNQMLPILCRQLIINQGISGIKLTQEETAIALVFTKSRCSLPSLSFVYSFNKPYLEVRTFLKPV